MTDLKSVPFDERTVYALERIATALEQMALNAIPVDALPTGEPPLPTPPADLPPTSPTAPLSATVVNQTVPLPPVMAVAPRWAAGMNHAAGHKPLKENNRGLYCPTKLTDGSWCQWAVKAG